jgi:hypothetical protein
MQDVSWRRAFVESFGIAIALLGGLVAAPIFCFAVVRLIRPFPALAVPCFWASLVFLGLFALELCLVSTRGVVGAREFVGPSFFLAHALLTLSLAPALACALLLGRRSFARYWFLAAVVCWFAGAGAIFYQYAVAETLYGVDGIGGPYLAPF